MSQQAAPVNRLPPAGALAIMHSLKLALDAWQEVPEGTIHTIPVRIDACDVLVSFRRSQWVNLFEPNGFDRIVRAIRVESPRLPGERATAPETDLPKGLRELAQQLTDPDFGPNPYQGLSAFTEKEADRFFGREQLTEDLWKVFRSLHNPHLGERSALRLLPILGPSGSGKSSVARAGLIPELARQPLPGLQSPRVAVIESPGTKPVEPLALALARIATNDPSPVAKMGEFTEELGKLNRQGAYDGLRRIAGTLPAIATSRLIILIDQFEEITRCATMTTNVTSSWATCSMRLPTPRRSSRSSSPFAATSSVTLSAIQLSIEPLLAQWSSLS